MQDLVLGDGAVAEDADLSVGVVDAESHQVPIAQGAGVGVVSVNAEVWVSGAVVLGRMPAFVKTGPSV